MTFLKKISAESFHLKDHAGGFNRLLCNNILDSLPVDNINVQTEYIFCDKIISKYPHITFKFDFAFKKKLLNQFINYNIHPSQRYQNFVCSFNGSGHVSRKLLTSILHRFNWFNPTYCSKNFSYSTDILDGHIQDYTSDVNFYRKFFVSDNSEAFFETINSFGHVQYNHNKNIYNLENKLTESFLHIVSETMATSYYPFVTEKFLYSIVTRGLFLAYAHPGWHAHVEKYYGFKLYTKLFDYKFDTIQNPVNRLIELMSMISKFSILSAGDWQDLYQIQQEEIEYNYDHYFSGRYLTHLKNYE